MSDKARKYMLVTATALTAWYLCVVLFWAVRPLTDSIPVGKDAKGVTVSQTVTCNTLFESTPRDDVPLPTLEKPFAYPREACTLVHSQARKVYVFDTLFFLLAMGGLLFIALRVRRLAAEPIPAGPTFA